MKKNSLFYKYFLLFASIITVVIVLLIGLSAFFAGQYWQNEKFKTLTSNAKALSAVANEIVGSSDYTLEISRTGATVAEASETVVFFVDINGNTFTCSDTRSHSDCVHLANTIDKSIMECLFDDEIYSETGTLGGVYDSVHYTVATPITGYYNGIYGAVFISCDAAGQTLYVRQFMQIFIISGIVCLIIAFLSVYMITRRLVKPVVEMSEAARAMAKGDYSHRITVDRRDELGMLESSFNDMIQAVQSLEVMRSSFVANVSHELKTPMTTIGGFIDGILDGTIPANQTKKYLAIVSDEVKRLSLMVNAMLSLSKLESGQTQLTYYQVNLTEIVCRIIISFSLKIENKNIEIRGMEDSPQLIVNGNYDLLYQMVYNLFDNAIKFTPQNGSITVSLDSTNGCGILKISNSGDGISQEDLVHIFERFYKTDKSRSKDKTGFGLGLYIVKSIVDIHNGRVSVESDYGKSTTFTISLPNK